MLINHIEHYDNSNTDHLSKTLDLLQINKNKEIKNDVQNYVILNRESFIRVSQLIIYLPLYTRRRKN
jgi:hypothetical protein